MRVQITARHCELPDPIRDRARDLAEKLPRFDIRVSGVDLVFEDQRRQRTVEGIVSLDRAGTIVARGEGSAWPAAVDALFDRLSRQVRKGRAQAVEHQAEPRLPEPELEPESPFED